VAEPSALTIGKRTMSWRAALAANMQWRTILRLIPSATNTDGIYDAEEFQWILKLGVWLRTQIEERKPIGLEAGQKFCEYERGRA
jgi:hypothetical protein